MFAIVPVHTREEHDIFALMMETSKAFSSAGHPDWTRLATEWSNHCNGTTVFYKVCSWPTLWHFSLCSNISIGSFLNTFNLISKFGMITATKKTLSHSTMMLPNVSKHSCNWNRAWYHLSPPCKHSLSKTQYMHTTTHHTPSWTLGTSVHSSITILCSSQLCWWSTMMPLTHRIHLWHQTNKMHRMKHKQRPQNGSALQMALTPLGNGTVLTAIVLNVLGSGELENAWSTQQKWWVLIVRLGQHCADLDAERLKSRSCTE